MLDIKYIIFRQWLAPFSCMLVLSATDYHVKALLQKMAAELWIQSEYIMANFRSSGIGHWIISSLTVARAIRSRNIESRKRVWERNRVRNLVNVSTLDCSVLLIDCWLFHLGFNNIHNFPMIKELFQNCAWRNFDEEQKFFSFINIAVWQQVHFVAMLSIGLWIWGMNYHLIKFSNYNRIRNR